MKFVLIMFKVIIYIYSSVITHTRIDYNNHNLIKLWINK